MEWYFIENDTGIAISNAADYICFMTLPLPEAKAGAEGTDILLPDHNVG